MSSISEVLNYFDETFSLGSDVVTRLPEDIRLNLRELRVKSDGHDWFVTDYAIDLVCVDLSGEMIYLNINNDLAQLVDGIENIYNIRGFRIVLKYVNNSGMVQYRVQDFVSGEDMNFFTIFESSKIDKGFYVLGESLRESGFGDFDRSLVRDRSFINSDKSMNDKFSFESCDSSSEKFLNNYIKLHLLFGF